MTFVFEILVEKEIPKNLDPEKAKERLKFLILSAFEEYNLLPVPEVLSEKWELRDGTLILELRLQYDDDVLDDDPVEFLKSIYFPETIGRVWKFVEEV